MQKVITKKLESLEPEVREWLLDAAAHSQRLADVITALRERGIEVSLSTLTRFVRQHRERVLVADGEDMKSAVETLAKRGQAETFRKGTLEALRQRFYEEALCAHSSPEESRKVFAELLKEEAKLKELELAERKMALAEEEVRLQKVKLRLAARAQSGRRMVKLDAANVVQNAEVTEGNGATEKVKALTGVVSRLQEILNRGGSVEEKMMEARGVLAEERKLLEEAKAPGAS